MTERTRTERFNAKWPATCGRCGNRTGIRETNSDEVGAEVMCAPCAEVERLRAIVACDEKSLPYPSCRMPDFCRGKGYCPRDPHCGE